MQHNSSMLLTEYQALSAAERIAAAKAIAANLELSPVEVYGALESITRPVEVKCQSLPPNTPCIIRKQVSGKKPLIRSGTLAL